MMLCAMVGCSNRSGRDRNVSYYRFPRIVHGKGPICMNLSKRRLQAWLRRVNRPDLHAGNLKHRRICSAHFHTGKPSAMEDEEDVDWAPSLKLGYHNDSEQSSIEEIKRRFFKRTKRIKRRSTKSSSCIVRTCENNYPKPCDDDDIIYHTFPDNTYFQHLWLNFCGIEQEIDVSVIRICSLHFNPDCYIRDSDQELPEHDERELLDDAVPTLFSPLDAECRITAEKIRELLSDVTDDSELQNDDGPIITQVVSVAKLW